MEDHIPIHIRLDRSLLFGRKTSKWSLWDVDFHENNSTNKKEQLLDGIQLKHLYSNNIK